jgi:SAM-dependent methyltransferase
MTTVSGCADRLIFLISLPRSGSTLLQHVIAGHPAVGSTAEPWILMPSVYALRVNGLQAEYGAQAGHVGLNQFLEQVTEGHTRYLAAVRGMALELYGAFLREHKKERFLDKTSRHYLIVPELVRMFPEARYVVLVRNPLAMLASYLDVMLRGEWRRLGSPPIQNDLLRGYPLVRQAVEALGSRAAVVTYEALVGEPERVVQELCGSLQLEYVPAMVEYGVRGVLPGRLVDPRSIHRHSRPVTDYTDAWRTRFRSAAEVELAHAFLAHLGRPLVEALGYDYDDLSRALPPAARGRDLATLVTAARGPRADAGPRLTRAGLAETWRRARRLAGAVRRRSRRAAGRLRRLRPSRTWANPLGLARRLLRRSLAERAGYVQGRMLDVGCGAQPYRELFPRVERYVGLDHPGPPRPDVCGDGLALPFRAGSFDSVLCNQVLEHVPEGATLMAEIARVLRPGGVLLLTVPLTWDLHREPDDFYRYTRHGLQYLADKSGLRVLDIAPTCGLWATLAQRVADTVINNYGRRWPWWLAELVSLALVPVLAVGGLADRIVGKRGDTLDWVMVATKP